MTSRPRCVLPLLVFSALGAMSCSKSEPAANANVTNATAATVTGSSASSSIAAPAAPPRAGQSADAGASLATSGPLNVLFITIDSLRADMPWAGYPHAIAPNLTTLAARSTVYDHAYSISSFTSKSVAGFLSGRYPSELARTGVFFTRYEKSNTFFCEALADQQIPCLAGQAHAYLDKGYAGVDQGFVAWKLVPGISFDYNKDPFITSQKLTPLAISMLHDASIVGDGSKPFFAWFHYMDPHDEYQAHDESPPELKARGNGSRARYDQEVFYTDLWIGKLLDDVQKQPWAAKTAIVISADHGEAFGEHGRFKHAHELYEELVHVPLIVWLPGQTSGRHIAEARSQIDLVPTFADLMHATAPTGLTGVSLRQEIANPSVTPPPARDIVTDLPEDEFNERRRSFLHEGWKIIAHGKDQGFELFHIADDPGELQNLYGKDHDNSKRMLQLYKDASAKIADVAPTGGIPVHPDIPK